MKRGIKQALKKVMPVRASTYSKMQKASDDKLKAALNKLNQLENELSETKRLATELELKLAALDSDFQSFSTGYQHAIRTLPEERERELRRWYQERTNGKELDLSNPVTFNEKIQWLKLNDPECEEQKAAFADKLACRPLIAELIGEDKLVPLLGSWDKFDDIDLDELPSRFALKCNHGSAWNLIVPDKDHVDWHAAKRDFDSWMATNFAFENGFELHYRHIKPQIIAEGFIEQDKPLLECQAWCFNGEPRFISAIHAPHGVNEKATYDANWNKLDFVTSLPRMDGEIKRPQCLDELLNCARKIASDFVFVRADFFITAEDKLLFSEATFTPASGVCLWEPPETDFSLGELLRLPANL